VKTSFARLPLKEGCSMLDLSTMSLFGIMAIPSLGRVFDGLRFYCERLSLFSWLP
jgi:hypothetical protein